MIFPLKRYKVAFRSNDRQPTHLSTESYFTRSGAERSAKRTRDRLRCEAWAMRRTA